ncbi:Rne/Rng family ribonuclease [Curtobacterium sp. RRHDQ10]|uniref:Rne/Rng family ribonuclease n=1 Tax=Curtobacterium phyllosphaerae TaxID=3413379 RepID=UPI003BF1A94E
MVEQNDKNEEGPKRRTRLFGGRRARSSAPESRASVPETVTDPVSAPDPSAADTAQTGETLTADAPTVATQDVAVPTDGAVSLELDTQANATSAPADVSTFTGDLTAVVEQTTATATPASDAVTPETVVQAPAAEPPATPFVPVATSTTSLIFHAPVLPALPERPFTGRSDRGWSDRGPDRAWSDSDAERPGRDDEPVSPLEDDHGDQPTGRRRSRRRGGQQQDESDGGQQRQPRQRREPELITEPQRIKGSTRLEAKKQRRRDGRDAGRRRTVITEDEFLARRESVDRQMIVRSHADRVEIGVLEDGVLAEHYVTKHQQVSLIGNVYLGKVQNVLPSMEAAFVDIGRGRNAVLYSGEVDWSSVETGNQPRRIELALKPGDKVLVQVTKDPVGHKGARLTSQISLPGRYLVYVPNGSMNGISRKLPDTERSRLKKILKEVLPEHAGVIVRTAAEGATEEQLTRDVTRLTSQWEAIQKKVQGGHAPTQLHSEPDLLVKIVRDVFNEDFTRLIIDGQTAHEVIDEYLSAVAPDLKDRVETYDGPDSFEEHRLNEQIEKALDRKVWLPSGGSLVIDRTEAMTVVDVNTGKFVGSGGNLEETVTKNNLEAAEEIVRQLRLRDIGGIIVVDFIDMVLETNRDLVLRRLMECLSRDRTKHQVAEVTSLGLVQMTRKKIGVGLQESLAEVNAKVNDNTAESSPKGGRTNRKARGSGNGSGGNGGNSSASSTQTHQITADVTSALSRIAASTIAHGESSPGTQPARVAVSSPGSPSESDAPEATTTEPGTDAQPDRPSRRSRRSRRGGDAAQREQGASEPTSAELVEPFQPAADEPATVTATAATSESGADSESGRVGSTRQAEPRRARSGRTTSAKIDAAQTDAVQTGAALAEVAPTAPAPVDAARVETASAPPKVKTAPVSRRVSTAAAVAPSDGPVAILDIPVATTTRTPRKVDPVAAESILDSVLQALPEPKQPGQGRARSRRVSSGSISAPANADASGSAGSDASSSDASGSGASGSAAAGDGPVILGS